MTTHIQVGSSDMLQIELPLMNTFDSLSDVSENASMLPVTSPASILVGSPVLTTKKGRKVKKKT